MPNWEERIYPSKLADRTAFDHDMYGVEVEVEYNTTSETNIPKAVQQFWSVVNDGSLRNYGKIGDCAVEFRYTKPLNSFTSAVAVKQLCQVLKSNTNEIYDSGRTSTHVHVNVCNINRLKIMNLITLSIIFDEFLVAQHHPFRSGNLFALRYVDAEWPVRYLVSAARSSYFRGFSNGNYRYASVNLTSIASFGTIEFRAMDGEINSQRINQWVFCLHSLKRKAVEYKNPREIIEKFHRMGAMAFLADHIPTYYILNTPPNKAQEMLQRGVILAADLAYATDWVSKEEEPRLKSKNPYIQYLEQQISVAAGSQPVPIAPPPASQTTWGEPSSITSVIMEPPTITLGDLTQYSIAELENMLDQPGLTNDQIDSIVNHLDTTDPD